MSLVAVIYNNVFFLIVKVKKIVERHEMKKRKKERKKRKMKDQTYFPKDWLEDRDFKNWLVN